MGPRTGADFRRSAVRDRLVGASIECFAASGLVADYGLALCSFISVAMRANQRAMVSVKGREAVLKKLDFGSGTGVVGTRQFSSMSN